MKTTKETHEPEKQKEALVKRILDAFQDPEHWPITDQQRSDLLRELYHRAKELAQCKLNFESAVKGSFGSTEVMAKENAWLRARMAELEAEVTEVNGFRETLRSKHHQLRDHYNELLARIAELEKDKARYERLLNRVVEWCEQESPDFEIDPDAIRAAMERKESTI